jgi:Hemingway/CFA97
MKALQIPGQMTGFYQDADNKLRDHRRRLADIKPFIDTKVPYTFAKRKSENSPVKAILAAHGQAEVTRENLKLARRIFNIMEGPGAISKIIQDRTADIHPGTLNFNARLREAKRIHQSNMFLAAKLDSVKPVYKVDLSVVAAKKKTRGKKLKKKGFISELADAMNQNNMNERDGMLTTRSDNAGGSRFRIGYNPDEATQPQSARRSGEGKSRPQNVLLEYTKIQSGRTLDVAVIKEPFRDRYAIFGIDIDDGQRYELRLSSEDVSNILDGDVLFTSVDNIEVWMALLNKVDLEAVEAFTKLPVNTPLDRDLLSADLIPSAPGGQRPSSKPLHRRGAGGEQPETQDSKPGPLSPKPPSGKSSRPQSKSRSTSSSDNRQRTSTSQETVTATEKVFETTTSAIASVMVESLLSDAMSQLANSQSLED